MAINKLSTAPISSNIKVSKSVSSASASSLGSIKMTPIAWVNLTSPQNGITIDNIPQGYKNLRLVMNLRGSQSGGLLNSLLVINNDSTATNYERYAIYSSTGYGVGFSGGEATDTFNYYVGESMSSNSIFLQTCYDFLGYSDTDRHKSFLSYAAHVDPNSSSADTTFPVAFLQHTSHKWKSLSGISKLEFSGSFKAGCTAALYGYGVAG